MSVAPLSPFLAPRSRGNTQPFMAPGGLSIAALMLVLAGCAAVGPDYQPPAASAPAVWRGAPEAAPRDAAVLARWWQQFGDPVLDALIVDALAANQDLASARAKLREARARSDLSVANLGPTVTASGSASRVAAANGLSRSTYDAGFDAGWEVDIFGGAQREREAAAADLQASAENLRAVRVSLAAEVARNYVALRATEQRLALTESSLTAQQDLYEITGWRQQAGLVSALDETQARTELARTRASLPGLRTTLSETRHRLAILLARPPGDLDTRLSATGIVPLANSAIAAGIPADTLRQRPDVRGAERRLAAQTARLGVAEAARYPSFRLGGSLSLVAASLGDLTSTGARSASLLAGITAPIFDAGRIRSTIAAQDAVLEQTRLAYQSAVLAALEETENALMRLANSRESHAQIASAADSGRSAFEIARARYAAGLADYQGVLNSQRTLIGLQDQLALSAAEVGSAQIQLYKALGGGWTATDEPGHTEVAR